jgi:hypothetical protein
MLKKEESIKKSSMLMAKVLWLCFTVEINLTERKT